MKTACASGAKRRAVYVVNQCKLPDRLPQRPWETFDGIYLMTTSGTTTDKSTGVYHPCDRQIQEANQASPSQIAKKRTPLNWQLTMLTKYAARKH